MNIPGIEIIITLKISPNIFIILDDISCFIGDEDPSTQKINIGSSEIKEVSLKFDNMIKIIQNSYNGGNACEFINNNFSIEDIETLDCLCKMLYNIKNNLMLFDVNDIVQCDCVTEDDCFSHYDMDTSGKTYHDGWIFYGLNFESNNIICIDYQYLTLVISKTDNERHYLVLSKKWYPINLPSLYDESLTEFYYSYLKSAKNVVDKLINRQINNTKSARNN